MESMRCTSVSRASNGKHKRNEDNGFMGEGRVAEAYNADLDWAISVVKDQDARDAIPPLCETSTEAPSPVTPARPPLMESQATQIFRSGTCTGGAIMPPPAVPKGSIATTSLGSSKLIRNNRWAPGRGDGRRQDKSLPGQRSKRPLGTRS